MLDDAVKAVLGQIRSGSISPEEGQRRLLALRSSSSSGEPTSKPSPEPGFRAVVITRPGGLDDLLVREVEAREPAEGEVVVDVRAFSLNFGDLLCLKGLYPTMPEYPFTPGFEFSGEVRRVGAGVRRLRVGDAVIGISGPTMGAQSATITVHERAVVLKPAGVSFEEACAFPVVFMTMRRAFDIAALRRGDTILIQSAAGGTGLVGVQLAQSIGAEVFATAGSAEKLEYLARMGVRHLVNYRTENFESRLRDMTGGRGLDVVVNTLSGEDARKSLNLLAPGGRYVELAMTRIKSASRLDLSRLVDNQSIHSLDLRKLLLRDPSRIPDYLGDMAEVLARGEIKPTVGLVFPFDRIREAYRALENRENIGKVVVSVPTVSARLRASEHDAAEPAPHPSPRQPGFRSVAVIGMSGRFPDADNLDEFWRNLAAGRDSVGELPRDRWDVDALYDPDPKRLDTTHCPFGGFLRDIDRFDALFFNISGKEALLMDPQQRLFLEEGWKALEDAGYATDGISNAACGVFVGVGASDYWDTLKDAGVPHDAQSFWGNEPSVLAARLSYLLNLKGASIAINTACSSSLTAIHLACQSIHSGESELAIAGGVFVRSTPHFHVLNSNAGMLSPDGRCKTFDDSANGYVPGEAVAALVLKDLEKALEDGDPIHGVIRSSAINQDGRTNGITAPSTLSQTKLEVDVYKKAEINPESIDYVEAHGTGTKLGDPIEIDALTNAFREFTSKRQFCAIGSVKTNIGHTVAAAGVAGVIKVLLAMRHRALPPSLHFRRPNEHIRFEESPFFVGTELREWPRPADRPRRAAVSSFGFSGTNAHLVLEESPRRAARARAARHGYMIVLSARTKTALKQRVNDLLNALRAHGDEGELGDVAYTLQEGRRRLPVRLALVVSSLKELCSKLSDWLDGTRYEGLCEGDLKAAPAVTGDAAKGAGRLLLNRIAEGGLRTQEYLTALAQLAELFVAGCELEWGELYRAGGYRRLSLPTYPFEGKRYWPEAKPRAAGARDTAGAHPLLDDVDLAGSLGQSGLVFRKRLEDDDPIVAHHVVNGQRVLPGVAHLEMVLEALQRVRPAEPYGFSDVVWLQPVIVDAGGVELEVAIKEDSGKLQYEVRGGTDAGKVVYSQGKILRNGATTHSTSLDLQSIKARTQPRVDAPAALGGEGSGAATGVVRGKFFHGLSRLWMAEREALGELGIPVEYRDASRRYILSPTLLDAALEASCGMAAIGDRSRLALPFAAERIEVDGRLPEVCYAHVTPGARPSSCNITITNGDGLACVRILELSFRELRDPCEGVFFLPTWSEVESAGAQPTPSDGNVLFVTSSSGRESSRALSASYDPQRVYFIEYGAPLAARSERAWGVRPDNASELERILSRMPPLAHIYFVGGVQETEGDPSDLDRTQRHQEEGVVGLFRLVKLLEKGGYGNRALTLTVVTRGACKVDPGDVLVPGAASVVGFSRSLAKEFATWKVVFIDLPAGELTRPDEALAFAASGGSCGRELALRRGRLHRRGLLPATIPPGQAAFRKGGTYLILGGTGGIGIELAKHLAGKYHASVALVGRRPLDARISAALRELEALGGRGLYVQADAGRPEELASAVQTVQQRLGVIHGAFHSAIVLEDGTLAQMGEDALRAVLAPKVTGSVSLYRALSGQPLDFLAFLSSAQSFVGSAGQSNYAAACAFKDAYALGLDARCAFPVRVINFGYWGEVGIVATEAYRRRLAAQGVHAISTRVGIEAVERVLGAGAEQVAVLKGTRELLTSIGVDWSRTIHVLGHDALPDAAEVLDATVAPAADRNALELWVSAFEEVDRFGARWLWALFRSAAGFSGARRACGRRELLEALHVAPDYARCFDALLGILERAGYVQATGDVVRDISAGSPAPLPDQDFERAEADLLRRFPEIAPQIRLLGACLRQLGGIVSGRVPALDVVFSESNKELVKRMYAGNVVSDHFNAVIARCLKGYVERRSARLRPGEKIIIVEIGAGTGGTSEAALGAIREHGERVHYRYTDISPAFVRSGQDRFSGRYPFASFECLDVERDPADQGFAVGAADVVIATNVIHATRDISRSLSHVKQLLRRNGWFLLNELTGVQNFTSLTFGLLKGWWLFDDAPARLPHSPLLSAEQWRDALTTHGFSPPHAIGLARPDGKSLAQHVLVAMSDGHIARRTPQAKEEPRAASEARASAEPEPARPASDQGVRPSAPARRPMSATIAARKKLEGIVLQCVADVLRVEPDELDVNTPYTEFGVDSLLAVDIVNRLNSVEGLDLKATDLFNYPTVSKLVTELLSSSTVASAAWAEPAAPAAPAPAAGGVEREPAAAVPALGRDVREPDGEPSRRPQAAGNPEAPRSAEPASGVAVIGMSGRFPGASNVAEFWDNLAAGRDCVSEVTRWDPRTFYDPDRGAEGKSYCKRAALIDDIYGFDALFFSLSPREAQLMDPQHRLFLEEAWKGIEDAGYSPESLSGATCSVFVGCGAGDYRLNLRQAGVLAEAYTFSGNSGSMLPARIAYFLNLKGASVAVDTACSSSLVAIHLACESLRNGTTSMAIAGGVTVMTTPEFHVSASRTGMLSPAGRCKTFDQGADGFVPGEAVGVVILKDLGAALRDGDHIYGTIVGSVINQDGKTNGITSPSGPSQTALALSLWQRFGIDPGGIGYVEAHGTGTKLGDPIEVAALTRAFREYTKERQFCPIGSVKTNVGHTLAAAGVVGLIKVLLCLKHRKLVPSLHLETENPLIELDQSPFFVNTELRDFEVRSGAPRRRALLSSFGFSGTNAQLLIEEPPSRAPSLTSETHRPCLVPLSGMTPDALERRVAELRSFAADAGKDVALRDAAYTLLAGRAHFPRRAAFVATSWGDLVECLTRWLTSSSPRAGISSDRGGAGDDGIALEARVWELVSKLRGAPGPAAEAEALGELAGLYVAGASVDGHALYAGEARQRVSLPVYPFSRERHLPPELERPEPGLTGPSVGVSIASGLHPLVHRNVATFREQRFESVFSGREDVFDAHRVSGKKVLPASAYLEMARAAGALSTERAVVAIRRVRWSSPLVFDDSRRSMLVSTRLERDGERLLFAVHGEADAPHADGELVLDGSDTGGVGVARIELHNIRRRARASLAAAEFYRRFEGTPITYMDAFRVVRRVDFAPAEALAVLELQRSNEASHESVVLDPTMLDGALQSVVVLGEPGDSAGAFLPVSADEVMIRGRIPDRAMAHVVRRGGGSDGDLRCFDVRIADEEGYVVIDLVGFTLMRVDRERIARATASRQRGLGAQASTNGMMDIASVLESVAAGKLSADEAERLLSGLSGGVVNGEMRRDGAHERRQ